MTKDRQRLEVIESRCNNSCPPTTTLGWGFLKIYQWDAARWVNQQYKYKSTALLIICDREKKNIISKAEVLFGVYFFFFLLPAFYLNYI